MNRRQKNNIVILMVSVICASIIGVYLGMITIYRLEIAANGFLGIATLYLFYLASKSPAGLVGPSVPLSEIKFPRELRYVVAALIGTMVAFWAGQHAVDAARMLLRLLIAG